MKKNYTLLLLTLFTAWVGTAQIKLTQSVNSTSVTDGGVACWSNATGEYRDNSFFRSYSLNSFSVVGDFQVSSVEYGQGTADDGKEIIVNIYTATSENLTNATLTLIASATHISSAANDLSLVSVPISAVIPAGSIVAFEVFAADSGTAIGQTFFPGYNSAGQNAPCYIKSTGCGINPPSTLATIGFPENQYVMNVLGNDSLGVDDYTNERVSIYPNPVRDVINISLLDSDSIESAEIFSVTGQLVYKGTGTQIDMSNLTRGVYTMKVITNNGDSVTKKLVKN